MTREEAERTLQEFYDFNKTLTPQGDSWLQADITINRYTQEELGKALPTAIAALRGPQPDLITGLVPCGCGGKVRVECYPEWAGTPKAYRVDCFNCHVGTMPCQTAEQAKIAWNRAMGWRVEE